MFNRKLGASQYHINALLAAAQNAGWTHLWETTIHFGGEVESSGFLNFEKAEFHLEITADDYSDIHQYEAKLRVYDGDNAGLTTFQLDRFEHEDLYEKFFDIENIKQNGNFKTWDQVYSEV